MARSALSFASFFGLSAAAIRLLGLIILICLKYNLHCKAQKAREEMKIMKKFTLDDYNGL